MRCHLELVGIAIIKETLQLMNFEKDLKKRKPCTLLVEQIGADNIGNVSET